MPVTLLTRRRWLATAIGTTILARAGSARAVAPLAVHDVVLIQPGDVLSRRIGQDAMAAWTTALQAAAGEVVAAHPSQLPTAGFVVVVTRPAPAGGPVAVHTWLDFEPALASPTATALTDRLAAVPAPTVAEGPVVVTLRVSLWGARAPARHAPAPAAWREAAHAAGHTLPLDELIAATWPPASR